MVTEKYDLPAYWASYLINGDATSFSLNDDGGDAEIAVIDEFMNDIGEGAIVTCSEEPFFSKYHDAQPFGIKAKEFLATVIQKIVWLMLGKFFQHLVQSFAY